MIPPDADVIGIMTGDVRLYYDLLGFLRARRLRFRVLTFDEIPPEDVGVVLTSEAELDAVSFRPVVPVADMETAVRRAIQEMGGMGPGRMLVVGVDPGPEPGIAVLYGGHVVETRQAHSPGEAADIIFGILGDYEFSRSLLRMGNGSPEHRDRLLEMISGNFDRVEVVDEARTSGSRLRHEESAVKIAGLGGARE